MRVELHIHTEDTGIFDNEKRNFQGEITIPQTPVMFVHYGLTSDKSNGRVTPYILNCVLHNLEPSSINFVTDWLYKKIKDKAKKVTLGDLRGKSDYVNVDKKEIRQVLNKWVK